MAVSKSLLNASRFSDLLPALTAGFIGGLITVLVEISFGSMIFSGELSPYASQGIGFTMFGGLVMSLIMALFSTFPGTIALPQDSPAAIMTTISTVVAAQLISQTTSQSAFATLVFIIILTAVSTGVISFLLGRFKLGNLIRYMPYPVVGGFLAGTGYLLLQGGFGVMADEPFRFARLDYLLQADLVSRWLPGIVLMLMLFFITRRYSHFLLIPSILLVAIVLFYVLLLVTGTSTDAAQAQKYLPGPFPESGLWSPPDPALLDDVDFDLVIGQAGKIMSIIMISIFSMLLNVSGLEIVARKDIDINRELQTCGIANVVAGFGGSTPGYPALSLSALGERLGSNSRVIGLTVMVMCAGAIVAGSTLLTLIPQFILGGMLCFLGISFLVEWLYDAWFRLRRIDYAVIVLITAVMGTVGVLEGVVIGMMCAIALFALDYSRVDMIRHEFSGVHFRSNVSRPRLHEQLISQKGEWIHIFALQGFIFFGTANRLLNRIRQRLQDQQRSAPRYVILDFRHATDIDTSTVISFVKLKQIAQQQSFVLIFTSLSETLQQRMQKEVFTASDEGAWRIFPDLDYALEWCEEQMLSSLQELGVPISGRSSIFRRKDLLPEAFLKGFIQEGLPESDGKKPTELIEDIPIYFERREIPAETVLFRQGDKLDGLYIIESGQVSVIREKDGQQVRLRVLGKGEVLGEVSFYTHTPATATIVTTQPTAVHYLSQAQLSAMEAEKPAAAMILHKMIAHLTSYRLQRTVLVLDVALK